MWICYLLLFVVVDDSDTFTRIHTFLSRRRENERERERERLGTTVENLTDRKKIFEQIFASLLFDEC